MTVIACPYCSQNISDTSLVCASCNGSLGIGSISAIRQALLADPTLSGNDSNTRDRLKSFVEQIDKSMNEDKHKALEIERIEQQKAESKKLEKELYLNSLSKPKRFLLKNREFLILVSLVVLIIGMLLMNSEKFI